MKQQVFKSSTMVGGKQAGKHGGLCGWIYRRPIPHASTWPYTGTLHSKHSLPREMRKSAQLTCLISSSRQNMEGQEKTSKTVNCRILAASILHKLDIDHSLYDPEPADVPFFDDKCRKPRGVNWHRTSENDDRCVCCAAAAGSY